MFIRGGRTLPAKTRTKIVFCWNKAYIDVTTSSELGTFSLNKLHKLYQRVVNGLPERKSVCEITLIFDFAKEIKLMPIIVDAEVLLAAHRC